MAQSSKPNPSTPPPGYEETLKGAPSTSQQATPAGASSSAAGPAPAAPPPAGPTPITAQGAHLLPFHDPRSPYALQQAVSRARWRFFGAFMIAWAISLLFGGITGAAVANGVNFR
jgi:hypothetical protein